MVSRTGMATMALFLATTLVTPATAQNMPVSMATAGGLGTVLVDQKGMTLYTFSADSPGVSMCSDACVGAWPPALADEATAAMIESGGASTMQSLGTMSRDDGAGTQLTWDGMPLYYFTRDTGPVDVNGNGVTAFGGTWSVVSVGS